MRSLAIIPARGGSKRVPGKNLADVGGKSLLVRAIESSRDCDTTAVSTDDQAARSVVEEYRRCGSDDVVLHERKPEHATDTAQLEDVIADVLAQHGEGVDAIVLLQPTSPFRTAAHVAEALRILETTGCDSVVSVTANARLHPSRHGMMWTGDDGGRTYRTMGNPRARPRSQECSEYAEENGAVYAFTRKHWDARRNRMGGDMRALVMHWSEAVDVDEPADLEAARRMAR